MRFSNGLGLVMPGLMAHVTNGGKTETIEIGLDTGIPGNYASVNTSYARSMGVSSESPKLDKLVIETANGPCTFNNLPVSLNPTVGSHAGHPHKIYLGAPLIDKMGGKIIFGEKGFSLVCGKPGGPPNLIPGIVGMSVGLIGTWVLLRWFFKK